MQRKDCRALLIGDVMWKSAAVDKDAILVGYVERPTPVEDEVVTLLAYIDNLQDKTVEIGQDKFPGYASLGI